MLHVLARRHLTEGPQAPWGAAPKPFSLASKLLRGSDSPPSALPYAASLSQYDKKDRDSSEVPCYGVKAGHRSESYMMPMMPMLRLRGPGSHGIQGSLQP